MSDIKKMSMFLVWSLKVIFMNWFIVARSRTMYYGLDFFENRLEEKNIFGVILEAVNSLCTSIVMSEKKIWIG